MFKVTLQDNLHLTVTHVTVLGKCDFWSLALTYCTYPLLSDF
jgi:hypothetical protein